MRKDNPNIRALKLFHSFCPSYFPLLVVKSFFGILSPLILPEGKADEREGRELPFGNDRPPSEVQRSHRAKEARREHSSVGLEHLPYKQRVGGSTPSAPTISPTSLGHYAEVAQLVEHNLAKVGVASSSLVFRSNKASEKSGAFFMI